MADKKAEIVKELEKIHPCDLSVGEVARKVKISDPTASTYLRILSAEGEVEISRKVGNAVFYRIKK
jgi:DNA-binding transcriptional ArsR family regulator